MAPAHEGRAYQRGSAAISLVAVAASTGFEK
jgi:hypothetical protein